MNEKINEFISKPIPQQILFFDQLLAPKLIRTAYWLLLLAVVWNGLEHSFTNGFLGFFEGLVMIVIGGLVLRIVTELIMLFFKNNELLANIAKQTKPATAKATTKAATTRKTSTAKKTTAAKKTTTEKKTDD